MYEAEFESLRRAWRERNLQRQAEADHVKLDAMDKALKAATFIREHFGAEDVYLYGSLAWEDHFGVHSDIDLLVDGFGKPAEYWKMLCGVWDITSPYPPSVVLAEDACDSLLTKVRQKGVML